MSECNNCEEYDNENHYCPKWCRVIGETIDDIKAQEKEERTAKVTKIEMPNPRNVVYKCNRCGQYMHRTSWSRIVNYCSNCGARLEWNE